MWASRYLERMPKSWQGRQRSPVTQGFRPPLSTSTWAVPFARWSPRGRGGPAQRTPQTGKIFPFDQKRHFRSPDRQNPDWLGFLRHQRQGSCGGRRRGGAGVRGHSWAHPCPAIHGEGGLESFGVIGKSLVPALGGQWGFVFLKGDTPQTPKDRNGGFDAGKRSPPPSVPLS